ncbi:MAG: hypothetical protein QW165_03045 [Candidatus Woesearchaeota archaeon]
MNKLSGIILVALLLLGTVFAIHDYQVYDQNVDSYTGQIARDRRIYDPYTRQRYFGVDYQRQFVNFGAKGPTDRLMLSGRKSAFSSVFNLDSNSLSNQGRDPAKISNWDPKVRGYPRLDRSVELLPYNPLGAVLGPQKTIARGTARLYSTGNEYGAGLNKPSPRTQIFIQGINLEPLGKNEIYMAWLYDAESEYAWNIGVLKGTTPLTLQLVTEFRRQAHMFDEVWITKEPFPSDDPTPHTIVLVGTINPARTETSTPPNYYERLR